MRPFAGVWIDRWDRHRTLVVTQVLSMIQSFALAGLALAGIITVQEIIWLSVAQGVINAFDMPARQAFVVEMIEGRERSEQCDRAEFFHGKCGAADRAVGCGNSDRGRRRRVLLSDRRHQLYRGDYFAAGDADYEACVSQVAPEAMWHELSEGWSYVAHSAPIRSVLLLLALVSLVGMPYTVLMPIFAGEVLHGGPHTLGFLMGATGVGALAGCNISGHPEDSARTGAHHSDIDGDVRCRADWLFIFPQLAGSR